MKLRLALAALFACLNLTACSSTSPLVPNKSLFITSTSSISAGALLNGAAVIGAVYFIYDPLAPNWEIEESKLADDTYRLSLKMKRYHTGGAGESIQVLKRRANQLQTELGFARYEILEYSEGIDSQTLGARRFAEGTVRLVERNQADSFLLNSSN